MIDFHMPAAVSASLAAAVSLPLFLAVAARVRPLAGRNGLQFLAATLSALVAWIAALWSLRAGLADAVTAGMILGGALLVYLEAWALLSRGYTLGILLTMLRAEKPLDEDAIAARYRGGESLSWIIGHRVSGLAGAGLVEIVGRQVRLTRLGAAVAWGYRLSIAVLGLRRTG